MFCELCTEPLDQNIDNVTHQEYGTICDDCNNELVKCNYCDKQYHGNDIVELSPHDTILICEKCNDIKIKKTLE